MYRLPDAEPYTGNFYQGATNVSFLTFEWEPTEHAERYGEDETQVETKWCNGCNAYLRTDSECEHDAALQKKAEMQTLICSCGSKTCGAITMYGLTEPTFHADIEPIPTQYKRDETALQLRRAGKS